MNSEGSLEKNETWVIEDLPPQKKTLGYKWVYKIKYNSNGRVDRYKARRLFIFDNNQVEGIDYIKTFALLAKMVTFLVVAVEYNWELHQMDVHNTFLHGVSKK